MITVRKPKSIAFLGIMAGLAPLATTVSPLLAAVSAAESNGVFIVGALHGLHETEESFGYGDLRRLVEAIDPDVMLLEVRPDELAERKETPGRPEYPAVIWPMLDEMGVTAVAMEPGKPLFTEMVTRAANSASTFEWDRPDAHALWSSYGRSLIAALTDHWTGLAETHDRVTGDLTRSRYIVYTALAGEEIAESQVRWDAYMVEQAREAISANPDRKVLVLGSYRNRHVFVDALRADFAQRVVDMEQWLENYAPR